MSKTPVSPRPAPVADSGPPSTIARILARAFDHGLAITILAAVITRLLHWVAVRRSDPFYAQAPPHFDMHTYTAWGHSIASGDWLSARFTEGAPFFYGPVYSYFLGFLFRLSGDNYDAVHLVQGALGVLVPVFLWLIARELFGPAAALATGLLASFCAPLLFYEQVLLMEGMLTTVHAALLWCVIRSTSVAAGKRLWPGWLATGLLAGIATVARSNFLLLIPLLAALPLLQSRFGGSPRRPAFTATAAFLGGAALILLLSLGRNVAVSGQWVLTTSNGPMNLYIGNAPDSTGILQLPPSFQRLTSRYGSEAAVPWSAELRRALADSPATPLRLFGTKIVLFWNSYDVADNVSYYAMKRYYPLVRFSPSSWIVLVPLALSGLWLTRTSWRRQLPLYIYAVGVPLTIALVFVLGRYRLPVLLPLLLWSGVAVIALGRMAVSGEWKRIAPHAALFAVAMILLWPTRSPAVALNRGEHTAPAPLIRSNDYNNLAQGQLDAGRSDAAREILEEGVSVYPASGELLAKLTDLYFRTGQPGKAVPILNRFVQLKGPAPAALGRLAEAERRLREPAP